MIGEPFFTLSKERFLLQKKDFPLCPLSRTCVAGGSNVHSHRRAAGFQALFLFTGLYFVSQTLEMDRHSFHQSNRWNNDQGDGTAGGCMVWLNRAAYVGSRCRILKVRR